MGMSRAARSLFWRAAFVLACARWLPSCDSPTLPLPPPSEPTQSADADPGYVRLDGAAYPAALVLIYNDNNGAGVIATADATGAYHTRLPVDFQSFPDGNLAEIWTRVGIEESPVRQFVIKPPARP